MNWVWLDRLEYRRAWDLQLEVLEGVHAGSLPDTLLICEHEPVFTLGAAFHEENLLLSEAEIRARGVDLVKTDRGGDVTYHGPGQLTIYPIFDLRRQDRDLHRWLRALEETQIHVLGQFGLTGRRFPPHTGAWVDDVKVSAIGVKVRKWVNLHGIALNVSNSLEPYSWIVPCGIREFGVSSLSLLTDREVGMTEARAAVVRAFAEVFNQSILEFTPEEIQRALGGAKPDRIAP